MNPAILNIIGALLILLIIAAICALFAFIIKMLDG